MVQNWFKEIPNHLGKLDVRMSFPDVNSKNDDGVYPRVARPNLCLGQRDVKLEATLSNF